MPDNHIEKLKIDLNNISTENELLNIKSKYLGKKGQITTMTTTLKDLSIEKKKVEGQKINILKKQIEALIDEKFKQIKNDYINRKLKEEKIDITLPSRGTNYGSVHPISQVLTEVIGIFADFGFEIVEGPEIETDYYNFESLNIPKDHPARDMQDTFYLEKNQLLRTHTSPMQIRVMEKNEPPIITRIKNRNDRFRGELSREIPIFEMLLIKESKITLKSYSELNNKKNKKIIIIRYINKYISS